MAFKACLKGCFLCFPEGLVAPPRGLKIENVLHVKLLNHITIIISSLYCGKLINRLLMKEFILN
jgi:hypothetical protein